MTLAAPSQRHRREGGFTLVEILVVLIIVAILMAVAATNLGGSKTAVRQQEAVVAAHSIQKAVEAFRRDREGRIPSDPADWPNAMRGPVDGAAGRPYMRGGFPEGSVNLHVQRQVGAAGAPTNIVAPRTFPGARLAVHYVAIVPSTAVGAIGTTYRIDVRNDGAVICTLTNDPVAVGGKKC